MSPVSGSHGGVSGSCSAPTSGSVCETLKTDAVRKKTGDLAEQPGLGHPSPKAEQLEPAVDAPDALPTPAQLRLHRGQRRRLRNPAQDAQQKLIYEINRRFGGRRGRVAGDADRTQPRPRVLLSVKAPLVVAIALPDRGELELNPVGDRRGDQRV